MRAFLCHSSEDSDFVLEVAKYLGRCLVGGVFYYEKEQRANEGFETTINRELQECEVMVIFVGPEFTEWQKAEVNAAFNMYQKEKSEKGKSNRHFLICLLGREDIPEELALLGGFPRWIFKDYKSRKKLDLPVLLKEALDVAIWILKNVETPVILDGLPLNPHLFDYEKDIIDHFDKLNLLRFCSFDKTKAQNLGLSKNDIEKIRRKWLDGCPAKWPVVTCWQDKRKHLEKERFEQWQQEFGAFRPENARVVAAALSKYHKPKCGPEDKVKGCMIKQEFCFPEAGPREFFYFPQSRNRLRVGILVSGGIAPGINAVIDGIVQRHRLYAQRLGYRLDIIGLLNGFQAFDDIGSSQFLLDPIYTSSRANEGGSILGTSRVNELLVVSNRQSMLESIVTTLFAIQIDILYIIGGDGSMKAAHAIWTVAQKHPAKPKNRELSIVTIPKTMDNDILWVWQAFGFLSAVEEARKVIEHLATEVHSNPRLNIVQLFGSDSGFVVSHAVHASVTRRCDAALIPEVDFSMKKLAEYLRNRMVLREELIPRGLVVMAETAIPTDALEFVDKKSQHYIDTLTQREIDEIEEFDKKRREGRRIEGQTSDNLRSAGLKIVSQGLKKLLVETSQGSGWGFQPWWNKLRVFTNEPRHLLRAIPPSCTDIIIGNRLGTLAVDNAIAGYTDFMISQWLTEYVLVPLELVVLGRKRIPKSGIFWKSTIAKTGQQAELS